MLHFPPFTSTHEQHYYSTLNRFVDVRQQEVQPSPVVHFYFLIEKILPNVNLTYNPNRLKQLENLINAQQWIAYNPDQEAIWQDIVAQLDQ